MRNSESFDPLAIRPYTVIRVHYEYRDEEPEEKLFVALKHDQRDNVKFCWCIKATSKFARYSAEPDLLKGCVVYPPGEIRFFPLRTLIDPANPITMLHDTLRREAQKGRYRIEGVMPQDFHNKIVTAIRDSLTLEPKKKKLLLECVGEKLQG